MSYYNNYDINTWHREFVSTPRYESVEHLFNIYETKIKERSTIIYLMEVFRLLENVFRNVILRPYLPAYRSINMNCGQYQSFFTPIKDYIPIDKLGFTNVSSNLLTYCGTNQEETMICAFACTYLIHEMQRELNHYDAKTSF